jgi:hypothetical protein
VSHQAYDNDVDDAGRATISKVEEAQNPLPPGTRIERFNVNCDGNAYTKA